MSPQDGTLTLGKALTRTAVYTILTTGIILFILLAPVVIARVTPFPESIGNSVKLALLSLPFLIVMMLLEFGRRLRESRN